MTHSIGISFALTHYRNKQDITCVPISIDIYLIKLKVKITEYDIHRRMLLDIILLSIQYEIRTLITKIQMQMQIHMIMMIMMINIIVISIMNVSVYFNGIVTAIIIIIMMMMTNIKNDNGNNNSENNDNRIPLVTAKRIKQRLKSNNSYTYVQ